MSKIAKKQKKKKYTIFDAMEIHGRRSKKSRTSDESRTAKNTMMVPNQNWVNDQTTGDVTGVDTKKYKVKTIITVIRHIKSSYVKSEREKPLRDESFFNKTKTSVMLKINTSNSEKKKQYLDYIISLRYNNVVVRRKSTRRNNSIFIIYIRK